MDSERREAYPGARFTQEELNENAKWAKKYNEFDPSNWIPRDVNIVVESIAVKLDALNRTMTSIKRALIVIAAFVTLILLRLVR